MLNRQRTRSLDSGYVDSNEDDVLGHALFGECYSRHPSFLPEEVTDEEGGRDVESKQDERYPNTDDNDNGSMSYSSTTTKNCGE